MTGDRSRVPTLSGTFTPAKGQLLSSSEHTYGSKHLRRVVLVETLSVQRTCPVE